MMGNPGEDSGDTDLGIGDLGVSPQLMCSFAVLVRNAEHIPFRTATQSTTLLVQHVHKGHCDLVIDLLLPNALFSHRNGLIEL